MWKGHYQNIEDWEWLHIATCPNCKINFEITEDNHQYIKIPLEKEEPKKNTK